MTEMHEVTETEHVAAVASTTGAGRTVRRSPSPVVAPDAAALAEHNREHARLRAEAILGVWLRQQERARPWTYDEEQAQTAAITDERAALEEVAAVRPLWDAATATLRRELTAAVVTLRGLLARDAAARARVEAARARQDDDRPPPSRAADPATVNRASLAPLVVSTAEPLFTLFAAAVQLLDVLSGAQRFPNAAAVREAVSLLARRNVVPSLPNPYL